MKYLNKLFAYDDRQSHQQSSAATLTSNLYTVTFIPESDNRVGSSEPNQHYQNHPGNKEEERKHLTPSWSSCSSSSSAKVAFKRNQISIISGDPVGSLKDSKPRSLIDSEPRIDGLREEGLKLAAVTEDEATRAPEEHSGIIGYLLAATIGKASARQYNPTTASTTKILPHTYQQIDIPFLIEEQTGQSIDLSETEDDWILLDDDDNNLTFNQHPRHHHHHHHAHVNTTITTTNTTITTTNNINSINSKKSLTQLRQMALDKADIKLIKASWVPVRKDPVASGVLLFKGLFIKFPQYLKFFPQFADLDLERMQENKRLLRHAVKVIETVTFVVDAIGDDSKTSQLNEALVNLVKSHLRRKIGSPEFHNLGIVLIDFICIVVGQGGASSATAPDDQSQLNKSSTSESINTNSSSIDSETMTSALDKLRASSSPSSSSEEESYLGPNSGVSSQAASVANNNLNDTSSSNFAKLEGNNDSASNKQREGGRQLLGSFGSESSTATSSSSPSSSQSSHTDNKEAKIDTILHLEAAWKKLYSIIMDLVKREEEETAAAAASVGE